MQEERKEALEWFVNFANMNLAELKLGDKAKLSIEASEYLFPHREVKELNQYAASKGMSLHAFKAFNIMKWAFDSPILPKDLNEPKYWERMAQLQTVVQKTLGIREATNQMESFWMGNTVFHWMRQRNGRYSLSWVRLYSNQEEYIETKLYRLLDGLPFTTVYQCPGCKKYSVNVTQRKKQFCSPRCMWRVNTAKRRDADREGYNKYQSVLKKDLLREKKGLNRLKTKSRKTKEGE
ncbi:MAG: hypothetical protein ABSH06_17015 [Thermodesulfobacteriota bacterium]